VAKGRQSSRYSRERQFGVEPNIWIAEVRALILVFSLAELLDQAKTEEYAMRKVIITAAGPAPVGPYSQAIRANGFVFVSGQVGLDPATQEMVAGGIAEQTERALKNVAAVLQAAGSAPAKIVRCVVYLKNMTEFSAMNAVYGKFFGADPPARTTIEAANLPKAALVEIEATALE